MQTCDATCWHCAASFFTWWKRRVKSQDREAGRSGLGSFNLAASTSVRAGMAPGPHPTLGVSPMFAAAPF